MVCLEKSGGEDGTRWKTNLLGDSHSTLTQSQKTSLSSLQRSRRKQDQFPQLKENQHGKASSQLTKLLISAPLRSSFIATNSSRLTSSSKFIREVWRRKMCLSRIEGTTSKSQQSRFEAGHFFLSIETHILVFWSGSGNSIFLSILPGRINAGSKLSILLVAMMTLTSCLVSKPSNWFKSSRRVRWISLSPPELESYLYYPRNFRLR